MNQKKMVDHTLFAVTILLFFVYIGIFFYLNMYKYTQHVDSDIAVDAMLAREIWTEKDLTPDNWISSTERLVVGVPAISSIIYGITGSMVFSMGLACVLTGGLLLFAIGFTLKRCQISWQGVFTALLALCSLPINGLRNDGQMVPFVQLLWFLFADYYALHSVCLFLCIAFYLYLREREKTESKDKSSTRVWTGICWIFLVGLCGGLALGGMRCLQVVILPFFLFEILFLFAESGGMRNRLPGKRFLASAFVLSLVVVGILAKLYPTNVEYPMYIQNAQGMADRMMRYVPAAVLECLGIAGGCTLNSFAALMQLGILAVLALTVYGLFFLFGSYYTDKTDAKKSTGTEKLISFRLLFSQRILLEVLGTSFLLTVLIEIVTNAETAHNYFFVIWFLVICVLALLITWNEQRAPWFSRLIVLGLCGFAVCNLLYTYKGCISTTDNLGEYQDVIDYMDYADISHGYAEFWDASRICIMTDGRITMGHCYHMEDLHMYWWTTSMKWYVPNLPEEMPTAYIVHKEDKQGFEAQFEDPSIVSLRFENKKFAVYTSDYNLVRME